MVVVGSRGDVVVGRAGSSVGAFYARFADKDALLHALYDRYYQEAIATADEALDPARWEGATIPEILSAVVVFLVEIYRERTGLMRAFALRNHADARQSADGETSGGGTGRLGEDLAGFQTAEAAHRGRAKTLAGGAQDHGYAG